jgi:hypothetical protein
MARILRCDNCMTEVEALRVPESPHPWPAVLTADPATVDPSFCTWKCLGEYATAKALVDSAEES